MAENKISVFPAGKYRFGQKLSVFGVLFAISALVAVAYWVWMYFFYSYLQLATLSAGVFAAVMLAADLVCLLARHNLDRHFSRVLMWVILPVALMCISTAVMVTLIETNMLNFEFLYNLG